MTESGHLGASEGTHSSASPGLPIHTMGGLRQVNRSGKEMDAPGAGG